MQVRVSDVKARKTINNDFHQPSNYCAIVPASYRHTQPRKKSGRNHRGLRKSNKARKIVQRLQAVFCPIPCHGNDTAVHAATLMYCRTRACKSCCCLRWCLTYVIERVFRISLPAVAKTSTAKGGCAVLHDANDQPQRVTLLMPTISRSPDWKTGVDS